MAPNGNIKIDVDNVMAQAGHLRNAGDDLGRALSCLHQTQGNVALAWTDPVGQQFVNETSASLDDAGREIAGLLAIPDHMGRWLQEYIDAQARDLGRAMGLPN
jgi:hypothetical protein